MRDPNPIKMFEFAFEKGLSGNINNFELWLKRIGIDPSKLSFQAIDQYFLTNISKAILYQEELNAIGELVGYYFKSKNELISIALIGISGIGKSFFSKMLVKIIESSKITIPSYILDCQNMIDDDYYENEFQVALEQKYPLYILDNCEKDRNVIEGTFKKLYSKIKSGIVISIWTPEKYNIFQEELSKINDFHKEFFLQPYTEENTFKIIKELLEFLSKSFAKDVKPELFSKIYSYCSGIPKNIVNFIFRLIKLQFSREIEIWDDNLIDEAAKQMHLIQRTILPDLSDIQKKILYFILISDDERGIRPMNLIDPLNLNKATISYHLNNLVDHHIIEQERLGRSVFYSIISELKPYIQLQISQEGAFNA